MVLVLGLYNFVLILDSRRANQDAVKPLLIFFPQGAGSAQDLVPRSGPPLRTRPKSEGTEANKNGDGRW